MFQARRLLECLLVLVSAPSTNLEISVFAGVRGLLLHFMSSQQGVFVEEGRREGGREGEREEYKLK